jgi:hypothetical protein
MGNLLYWAVVFLIIAPSAAALGFGRRGGSGDRWCPELVLGGYRQSPEE